MGSFLLIPLLLQVQIRFPVWRELKLIQPPIPRPLAVKRSDTLSRLKGIETSPHSGDRYTTVPFRYAFPFEGNWNSLWTQVLPHTPVFRYAFPFEGNWNPQERPHRSYQESCSDTLSRLKGIETIPRHDGYKLLAGPVQIRFPVWRELKLSGAESSRPSSIKFRYAFPFEGNWNFLIVHCRPLFFVCSDTLSRLKGIETRLNPTPTLCRCYPFRYAFPFEGNWNPL